MILLILKTILYLVLLLLGSEQVVRGSIKWTKCLGVSSFFMGFLLVALGTSIPEMVTAFISAHQSKWELVLGNLIGSNLFNTLIVLGTCALFGSISVSKQEMKMDIPVLLFCSLSLTATLWNFHFSRWEALFFICLYFTYILFLFFSRKEKGKEISISTHTTSPPQRQHFKTALQILLGFACLHLGGQGFIENCLIWIKTLHWNELKVGIFMVALGTSLPELAVSLWALWKKEKSLALGNILGSNLLNIWLILGLSRFFLPKKMLLPSIVLHRDAFFLLGITLLLVLFLFLSQARLRRWHGFLFLLLYGLYAMI